MGTLRYLTLWWQLVSVQLRVGLRLLFLAVVEISSVVTVVVRVVGCLVVAVKLGRWKGFVV
jgi:hypothetical protein